MVRHHKTAGFALLELLIGLVILSAALSAGYVAIRNGMMWLSRTGQEDAALDLAEGLLERAGHEFPLHPGVQTGQSEKISWRIVISEVVGQEERATGQFIGYWVEVSVNWAEWPFAREMRLRSVRLGPRLQPQ